METDKSMKERAKGCLALLPLGNLEGSVKFLDLKTLEVITRSVWVPLPITQETINYINGICEADNEEILPRDPTLVYRQGQIMSDGEDNSDDEDDHYIDHVSEDENNSENNDDLLNDELNSNEEDNDEDAVEDVDNNENLNDQAHGEVATRAGRVRRPSARLRDDDFQSHIPKVNSKVNAVFDNNTDANLAKYICDIDNSYEAFVRKNGGIVVKLRKALYGCIQSSLLWFNHISKILLDAGFSQNPCDECVFNCGEGKDMASVIVYIDDLLIVANDTDAVEDFIEYIQSKFEKVAVHRGKVHSYLGMNFDFGSKPGGVLITMRGYIEDLLRDYEVNKSASTPANNNLFKEKDGKSHSARVVAVGNAAVSVKSQKQKIVTKSSTESEIVCVSDMMGLGYHVKRFFGRTKSICRCY